MTRNNFTLSPAYAVGRAVVRLPEKLVPAPMPAWTLLSAVMLASMVVSTIWFG
jgi:hypothetical protein